MGPGSVIPLPNLCRHACDRVCGEPAIEHFLICPGRPETGGTAERFNGRIIDLLRTRHGDSGQQRDNTVRAYKLGLDTTLGDPVDLFIPGTSTVPMPLRRMFFCPAAVSRLPLSWPAGHRSLILWRRRWI